MNRLIEAARAVVATQDFVRDSLGKPIYYCVDPRDLTALRQAVEEADAICRAYQELHRAAAMVRSADTYVHPMLSRREAVEKGVYGLYVALDRLDAILPLQGSNREPPEVKP